MRIAVIGAGIMLTSREASGRIGLTPGSMEN